jgi:hypothetical protein
MYFVRECTLVVKSLKADNFVGKRAIRTRIGSFERSRRGLSAQRTAFIDVHGVIDSTQKEVAAFTCTLCVCAKSLRADNFVGKRAIRTRIGSLERSRRGLSAHGTASFDTHSVMEPSHTYKVHVKAFCVLVLHAHRKCYRVCCNMFPRVGDLGGR